MAPELAQAARAGRFLDASRIAERQVTLPEVAVLRAEIGYFLGQLEASLTDANRLSLGSLSSALRCRCVSIAASVKWDVGDLEESLKLSARALELAREAKDLPLTCRTSAYLLERNSSINGFGASLALAAQARRSAIRSGDPQSLAFLHLVHGRLEARVGRLEIARRHFNDCRELLDRDDNLWMRAASYLDESGVLSITGANRMAMSCARRGIELAEESGWSKGIVAGAANLAFLYLRAGEPAEANKQLRFAARQTFSSASFRCALDETAARVASAIGNDVEAEEILRRCLLPSSRVPVWYSLKAGETLVRLHLRNGRYEEGLALAEECLDTAQRADLEPSAVLFRLAKIEALTRLQRPWTLDELPFATVTADSPPFLHAALSHTLAAALANVSTTQATAALDRAARLSSDALVQRLHDGPNHKTSSASLDSAVALLELAGHPHILGREALALLRGSNCSTAAALVSATPSGSRIVETAGWSDAEAKAAAASPGAGVEHLPIGRRGDETWTLVVRPRRELDAYCAYAAIRKLLTIALSLETYRRDEKQRAALWPADALDGDPECIWASEQMTETLSIARRIAPTPLSVLITGETGTGKEMLARAIHRASDRADKLFLPFNCTAVPREMLDSQLFGHRKGAFTGADTSFAGVIRAAAGGTLFLDEIGEIGPAVQPKLLRFLESHEIHPLGEPHPVKVDVRIVAATNASVEQMVADGRFREDLFYRLNVVRLMLPPLRERREEIPALVHLYMRKYGDEYKKGRLTLSDETLEYLLLFSWPGNVRQLANEVRRMAALAEPDATLTPAMLSPAIQASRRTIPASPAIDQEVRVALDQPLPAAVEMLEQLMVRHALDRAHGRVEEASRLLGISRKGLFLKRRRWGLGQAS